MLLGGLGTHCHDFGCPGDGLEVLCFFDGCPEALPPDLATILVEGNWVFPGPTCQLSCSLSQKVLRPSRLDVKKLGTWDI